MTSLDREMRYVPQNGKPCPTSTDQLCGSTSRPRTHLLSLACLLTLLTLGCCAFQGPLVWNGNAFTHPPLCGEIVRAAGANARERRPHWDEAAQSCRRCQHGCCTGVELHSKQSSLFPALSSGGTLPLCPSKGCPLLTTSCPPPTNLFPASSLILTAPCGVGATVVPILQAGKTERTSDSEWWSWDSNPALFAASILVLCCMAPRVLW